MPRQRLAQPRKHVTPTRLQDGTGLEESISTTIVEEFITPLEVRVEVIEGQLAELLASGRFSIQAATVELTFGWRGGTTTIEGEFGEDVIGRPVMIVQSASGDRDEMEQVLFTGEIVDARTMRVRWFAPQGAPSTVEVVYLIG